MFQMPFNVPFPRRLKLLQNWIPGTGEECQAIVPVEVGICTLLPCCQTTTKALQNVRIPNFTILFVRSAKLESILLCRAMIRVYKNGFLPPLIVPAPQKLPALQQNLDIHGRWYVANMHTRIGRRSRSPHVLYQTRQLWRRCRKPDGKPKGGKGCGDADNSGRCGGGCFWRFEGGGFATDSSIEDDEVSNKGEQNFRIPQDETASDVTRGCDQ